MTLKNRVLYKSGEKFFFDLKAKLYRKAFRYTYIVDNLIFTLNARCNIQFDGGKPQEYLCVCVTLKHFHFHFHFHYNYIILDIICYNNILFLCQRSV